MKKILSIFMLLVAFTTGAWGETKTLYSTSSSLTTSNWGGHGDITFSTGSDATVGDYINIMKTRTISGNRGAYLKMYATGSDFYASYDSYTIDFDIYSNGGWGNNNGSTAEICLLSEGASFNTSGTYSSNYLLNLQASGAWATTFAINGSGSTVTMSSGKWYHINVVVDNEANATYTVSEYGSESSLATGTFKASSSYKCQGIYILHGRGGYDTRIANFAVTTEVSGDVANEPSITETAVNGENREYSISFTDGETLHYTLPGGTEETTTTNPFALTVTSEGTLSAYTTKGSATSNTVNATVTHGAITLNAPTISYSNMVQTGDYYYPVVTIANSQSDVEMAPTATLSYEFNGETISATSPYTFTSTGTLTAIVSAAGYTSNSVDFEVENGYIKTKTVDLAAISEGELSGVWKKTSDASQLPATNWINRYSSDEFPLYIYDYTNAGASSTDVIDGLVVNISSPTADPGITPTLYVGAGMILPSMKVNKSDLSASSTWNTNISISVDGATSGQIAVYTYPTDYGKSIATSAIVANTTFNLYRYSDMLTKVEVYSPSAISGTLPSSGIGTLASAYALDLSSVEAYVISEIDGSGRAICTRITEAPANTGIIIVGEKNAEYSIPVVASATLSVNNLLEAAVTATPIEANEAYIVQGGEFHLVTEASTVPAGKAYLPASVKTTAKAISLSFGEITGISEAEAAKATVAAEGKFIENGKLVIVKNGQKYNANGQLVK